MTGIRTPRIREMPAAWTIQVPVAGSNRRLCEGTFLMALTTFGSGSKTRRNHDRPQPSWSSSVCMSVTAQAPSWLLAGGRYVELPCKSVGLPFLGIALL
jgi:hypothetical protein